MAFAEIVERLEGWTIFNLHHHFSLWQHVDVMFKSDLVYKTVVLVFWPIRNVSISSWLSNFASGSSQVVS